MADTETNARVASSLTSSKPAPVRPVLEEARRWRVAAGDLDLTETALREWVKRARADRTHGRTGLTTAESVKSWRASGKRIASCGRSETS